MRTKLGFYGNYFNVKFCFSNACLNSFEHIYYFP